MRGIRPEELTIAITVYNRREFVAQAIASALHQTSSGPWQVMVVEDHGPDPTLRDWIVSQFGDRIRYHRNEQRRGLFDNWNACLELCTTPWLCILHDDDILESSYLAAMLEVSAAAPGRNLYYGECNTIGGDGRLLFKAPQSPHFAWNELPLERWTVYDPVCFPGQMFKVESALRLGGFRGSSRYCGDWEMWFRLALDGGAAATNRVVANYREHSTTGRGTTSVDRSGRKYAYVNMQRKRHVAWLRKSSPVRFDRRALQAEAPMPVRFLLRYAGNFSDRMLRYNVALVILSTAPNLLYRFAQIFLLLFSWRSARPISRLYQLRQSRL